MCVLLLAIGAEDVLHEKKVKLIGIAADFVVERLECSGGEGTLAGEKKAAVFGSEQIVELGGGETKIGFPLRNEGALPYLEADGLLILEGDCEEFFLNKGFECAFQSGGGNMGGLTEIVVTDGADALAPGEMPEAEVDGLLCGPQIGEHRAEQLGKVQGVGCNTEEEGEQSGTRGKSVLR